MATVWEEFGVAVAKAIGDKNWTLAAVADVAFGNSDRKGYVSQITKGRTKLNRATIQKLAKALDLPASVTDKVYRAHLPPEDEVTETDHLVEPLLKQAETDPAAAKLAESLLITLAYEFAGGHQGDVASAYANLRGALEAAQRLIAQGTMPSNLDAQVQATLAEVSRLMQDNRADEASALVDRELARLADEVAERNQARSQLHQTAFDLARTQNNPKSAADHILAKLTLDTPPDLFSALRAEQDRWYETGRDQGGAFDLELSIHLAKASLAMAQTPDQRGTALNDLATSLATLGNRETDPARLQAAVDAYGLALLERTRDRVPLDWAMTHNNLGAALQQLGKREGDPARLQAAVTAYENALLERTRDRVPLDWAMTQGNLASLDLAFHVLSPDPARLVAAKEKALAAREVFATAKATAYVEMVDRTLAEIDAA